FLPDRGELRVAILRGIGGRRRGLRVGRLRRIGVLRRRCFGVGVRGGGLFVLGRRELRVVLAVLVPRGHVDDDAIERREAHLQRLLGRRRILGRHGVLE